MSFSDKSLNILELPAVLQLLAAEAVSSSAKEEAMQLTPSASENEVARRVAETTDARAMITIKGNPYISDLRDVRPSLSRANLGGSLNTVELLSIAAVLRSARLVRSYVSGDSSAKTSIDYLFYALRANKALEEKISTSVLGEDEIADAASHDLAEIRRKIRAAAASARDALQKIINSQTYAKVLQEPIITMRSERFVVPVKAEFKGSVPGLVHDISASGQTLFIEPMAAVKANNELRELAAKEKLEIERILAELSAQCAENADDISSDFSLLTRIDLIFAKAKLSFKLDCGPAEQSAGQIVLRRARHPLLDKSKAVPIDVSLGESFDTLVITGPNTGGKTVSLKTIGLLSAMNQCGLHIPCADGSCLPVFGNILADIGDEQSIEQSLSTFSAHMINIIRILEECNEKSLVLFDELGAGTDPTEGAALAISIIEYVRNRGGLVAATTHYSELKVYATNEPGVQNASCEFDVETLRPTYKLLIGIPGKSNAFAISRRLGLGEGIIEDAAKRVSTDNADFEATIEKLEQTRLLLEKDRDEAEQKLRNAREEEKKASRLRAELEVRLEKAEIKTRREAERIIEDAKAAAESAFAEIDEMKRRINEEENVNAVNEARNELRRRLNESAKKLSPAVMEAESAESARPLVPGDTVRHKSTGFEAVVVSINSDRVAELKSGAMTLRAKEADLLLIEKQQEKPGNRKKGDAVSLHSSQISPSIDLRGMESLDGVIAAEQYIDSAVMAKLKTVTIIHGKGTGALRAAIQQMLKKNRFVKSFRLGRYGEGESGVTIVELK